MKPNAIVIDDEPYIYEWICQQENGNLLTVKGKFKYMTKAYKALIHYRPELVFLGIKCNETNVFDAIEQLRLFAPESFVIVLTDTNDAELLLRMHNLGVNGLMDRSKRFGLNDVIIAYENNCNYIQPDFSISLVNRIIYNQIFYKLSNREFDVLKKSLDGQTCELIAHKLCVSRRTITEDRKKILYKLGYANFEDLRLNIYQMK
jgi:DNA-binding NarL/FixJ family response regulator